MPNRFTLLSFEIKNIREYEESTCSFSFLNSQKVYDDVDSDSSVARLCGNVYDSKIVALCGINASGKTTLLSMIRFMLSVYLSNKPLDSFHSLLQRLHGSQDIEISAIFAVGGAVGGLLGKMLFSFVAEGASDPSLVSLVQNIVMVVLTLMVLFYVLLKSRIHTLNVMNPAASTLLGLLLGVLSSFLGIGGGPINIMLLSFFFSMDSKTAALTSLYIIFFSQAVSFISTLIEGFPPFEISMLLPMMVAAVLGATLGRAFSKKMSSHAVDVLFSWMLVIITLISIYNCVRFA